MGKSAAAKQKQRERFFLDCFLKALKLPISYIVEHEAPDFLINTGDRWIGIEVTELFVPQASPYSLQAHESLSSRIVQQAKTLYQDIEGPPVHVNVGFSNGHDLRNADRDDMAGKLASFVKNLHLEMWQRFDATPEDIGELPEEVSFLHVLRVPEESLGRWNIPRAGWVHTLTNTALQSCIEKKAQRLAIYKSSTSENWLLIVADRTNPSQLFDRVSASDARDILSPFSRTYFFGLPENEVVRIGSENNLAD
jgi:hypothetical protein